MQTTIKIPDREIERLDKLREAEGISRAELIRRGISAYLATLQPDEAFGAWRQHRPPMDGSEYQEKSRAEWEA